MPRHGVGATCDDLAVAVAVKTLSKSAGRSRRVQELDAVRGLAALSVVLGHCVIAYPAMADNTRADGLTVANVLKYTPLKLVFDGFPAVMIFFVLSGFVLALQLSGSGREQSYGTFVARRVCRIWIPYMAAVALAMVVAVPFIAEPNAALSEWYALSWNHAPDVTSVLQHVLLIDSFPNDAFDPVLWSLVHEMRISLVFPVIMALAVALGPTRSVLGGVVLTLVGYAGGRVAGGSTDYFESLTYVVCFVVGIQLAIHRDAVVDWAGGLTSRARGSLWVVAVLTLSWQATVPRNLLPHPLARLTDLQIFNIVVVTVGAAIVIVLAQTAGPSRALMRRFPQYLGRISYSLYLVHTIVLLAMLHLVPDRGTSPFLLPLVLLVSFALATLMQRFVEQPAQRLGRRFTGTGRPAGALVGGRLDPVLVLGFLGIAGLSALLGLVAVINPPLAIGLSFATAFVLVAISNLTAGVAVLAFLAFTEVLPGLGTISAAKLAGGVIVLSWIAAATTRTDRPRQFFGAHGNATMLIVLFVAWITVGATWAQAPSEITDALIRYLPDLLLFPLVFAAVRSGRDAKGIVVAFVLGALLSTLYGAFISPGEETTGTAAALAEGRITGAGVDPNQLAAGLVAGLVMCGATFLTRTYSGVLRVTALFGLMFLFVALVVTASRTGIVALIAAALAAVLLAGPGRRLAASLVITFALALGVGYITQAAPAAARERLSTVDPSGSGRADIWKVAVRVARDHMVGGVGSQNFPIVSRQYVFASGSLDRTDFIIDEPLPVHNTYLELWAETGVIGAALFLAIVGWCLSCGVRAAQAFARVGDTALELLSRGVVVATSGMLAAGFFISFEHEKALWLMLALSPALLKVSRRDPADGTLATG